MGRIQSSVGLITGVPIADTVEQLIALSARPRDFLVQRTTQIQQQQVAIAELTALVIGVQFASDKLGKPEPFNQRTASSSHADLLSASVTGQPAVGVHQFTPVRQAQTHQLLSNGFAALDQPLAEGSLSLRYGGVVDKGVNLSDLNSGRGVHRGRIRITDRSGASAIVDLRFAQTINDVLEAINSQTGINVTAAADGDRLKLIDNTGQTLTNLKVQQFGLGTTAADIGLAGIDVASSQASGQDVLSLHNSVNLSQLNDGNGVSIRAGLPDLELTFRDGSSPLQINLSEGGEAPKTIGELVSLLNSSDPTRLQASISGDGDRLVLTDLTSGTGSFSVSSPLGGSAAEDLGLTGTAAGGSITSRRLQSGLKTSLLSSLGGGYSLGQLGQVALTDRNGASATVDLASAETLDEVVSLINGASVSITARINDARNGIVLVDDSGGSGNLIVGNTADGTNSADKLGITVNDSVSSVNSGSLRLQFISEQSSLDSLFNGRGISTGSFRITDSNGETRAVNLKVLGAKTIGDVINAINGLGIGVTARTNDTGDGILLVDTAGGSGQLRVADVGNGTAAKDLRIAGEAVEVDIGGIPTKVIDGATTVKVNIESGDTLQVVIDKINALDADVTASAFNDGSPTAPYRLSLVSQISGRDGELLIDASGSGFSFQQLAAAQDALILVGSADSAGAGVLASSSTNTFDQLIDGVSLKLKGVSTDPVTITINSTDESLVKNAQQFVDAYNRLRDKLDQLTEFNPDQNTTGILFGTGEALRIDFDLPNLLTGRFAGTSSIRSLAEVGITLDENGKMQLNSQKLKDRFAADPQAVEQFFTDEDTGVAAKLHNLIETLAGKDNSLLINRSLALQQKIDTNTERVAKMNERLDRERERLLNEFFAMEETIARLQANLSSLQLIQSIPPLSFGTSQQQVG